MKRPGLFGFIAGLVSAAMGWLAYILLIAPRIASARESVHGAAGPNSVPFRVTPAGIVVRRDDGGYEAIVLPPDVKPGDVLAVGIRPSESAVIEIKPAPAGEGKPNAISNPPPLSAGAESALDHFRRTHPPGGNSGTGAGTSGNSGTLSGAI